MNVKVRFRINANGPEVFVSGKWYPADAVVLSNVIGIMRQGLYDMETGRYS